MSEEEIQETVSTPGVSEILVAARKHLGYSQKEVADKLYLTTTFIRYIDAGEFDKIPKQAFVKGYLRSYARTVNLSDDEIVALYEAELESHEPAPEIKGVTEEDVSTSSITGPVLQTGLIGFGVLLLIVALVWWLVSEPESPAPRVTQPTVQSQEPPELVEPVLPESTDFDDAVSQTEDARTEDTGTEDAGTETARTEDTRTETAATVEALPADEDGPGETPPESPELTVTSASTETSEEVVDTLDEAPESEEILFERTSDGERSFITVDAGGFDQLEISFTDECWVEVGDSEQGLIYHDLNDDGDVLTIYGTGPFEILLGRATGVEMIYNGRSFDVESYINQDKTAKLTVSD